MAEIAGEELKILSIDHHGLIAAVCKDLKIAEKINEKLGFDKQRVINPGQSVIAMILNGLGFTNRRLYLTHQFFQNKPVDRLLGNDTITFKDITDYTLSHTLDEIHQYGTSKLFGEIAFSIAIEHKLLGNLNHLDTTSLSVEGDYNNDELNENEVEPKTIKLTHGHSKDHRSDLKQAVLSLVVNGPSSMPIWMDALDGNSSDKKSFHETIKKVQEFKKQINLEKNFKWVADSALYTKDKLLKQKDYYWLTRVPETIKEAKDIINKKNDLINWELKDNGYKTFNFISNYGDVKQRWQLIFSQQAYTKEVTTLEKNIDKKFKELTVKVNRLNKKQFNNKQEIELIINELKKNYKLFTFSYKIIKKFKYLTVGRPKENETKTKNLIYKLELNFNKNQELIDIETNRKGKFILATNDLNEIDYPNDVMLQEYKEQQHVERGFKFLKDPWFMVDSIFLKLPSRIEALMMVMTLCLMVYNIGQYKLRKALKENNDTLPNQVNKKIQNPTLRWIFQLMEGINIAQFFDKNIIKPIKELVANLNNLRIKIIKLFGNSACYMYGVT